MQDFLFKILAGFILSLPYTFFSFLIMYGLSHLKNKEESIGYSDVYGYLYIANAILIALIFIIFNIPINI